MENAHVCWLLDGLTSGRLRLERGTGSRQRGQEVDGNDGRQGFRALRKPLSPLAPSAAALPT